jgi:putative two-component system response regulator
LIVDDTPNNIKILIEVLRNDYVLLVANSGFKALEMLHNPVKPDIVILDVNMPDMNGYEVIKRMKQD